MKQIYSNQTVLLNGEPLANCFAADPHLGIARVFETDGFGNILYEDQGGNRARVKQVTGKVEIVDNKPRQLRIKGGNKQ